LLALVATHPTSGQGAVEVVATGNRDGRGQPAAEDDRILKVSP
jgi:hypothetical protein